jgi:hypothetical protein
MAKITGLFHQKQQFHNLKNIVRINNHGKKKLISISLVDATKQEN